MAAAAVFFGSSLLLKEKALLKLDEAFLFTRRHSPGYLVKYVGWDIFKCFASGQVAEQGIGAGRHLVKRTVIVALAFNFVGDFFQMSIGNQSFAMEFFSFTIHI